MKLLNPFAGYRYVSGHVLYHLAMLLGSFTVNYFEEPDELRIDDEGEDQSLAEEFKDHTEGAIRLVRWTHLICVIL